MFFWQHNKGNNALTPPPHHPPTTHPGWYDLQFADDIFRCISVNEKFCILIKTLWKFASKGLIDNNPALVYIMTSYRIGEKPLSEPMAIRLTDAFKRY